MIFLWGAVGLILLVLFVLMLRNMYFNMLDERANLEYLKALEEGMKHPMPIATSMAPGVPAPIWADGYYADRARGILIDRGFSPASSAEAVKRAREYLEIRKKGAQLGNQLRRQGLLSTNSTYAVRRPFLGAEVSGPSPGHFAMYTGDGRVVSPGLNYTTDEDFMRFKQIKDQI